MSDITLDDIKKAYFTKPNKAELTLCYSGKKVILRQMKIKDKKEILKTFDKDDEEIIDKCVDDIIEKYVEDEDNTPIKASTLLEEEREQLFIALRRNATASDSISIDYVCPACKERQTVKFAFDNIKTTNFVKPDGLSDVITSDKGNVNIIIGHLTRGDMIEIRNYINENKITSDVEKNFINLAATIKQVTLMVDDVPKTMVLTLKEKIEFVDTLTLDDFEKIKPYFKNSPDFGTKLGFTFTCTKCAASKEVEAKLVDFFIY